MMSLSSKPILNRPRWIDRNTLARQAALRAGHLRRRLGIGLWDAVCPFDIAQQLGVEVRFQNLPSMDGMYCQQMGRPLIVLASERPAGRQNFNGGHEIGHHEFDHGTRIDEYLGDHAQQEAHGRRGQTGRPFDPDEFLADRFASFLLMPKSAVQQALACRRINPSAIEPIHIYQVANWFGVGYRTLVEHLCFSLNLISSAQADVLRTVKLPQLRAAIVGRPVKHIIIVDQHWQHRPVDLHVGDLVLAPMGWHSEGNYTLDLGEAPTNSQLPGVLIQATRQGLGSLFDPLTGTVLPLRVSRQGYVGRSIFRHLDDPDHDLEENESGST